jgi:uncharacterized protein YuzE
MNYDADANIISWEIADDSIVNTLEMGNFLIHVSASGKPVLIEILNGSRFVGKLEKLNLKKIENIKLAPTTNL